MKLTYHVVSVFVGTVLFMGLSGPAATATATATSNATGVVQKPVVYRVAAQQREVVQAAPSLQSCTRFSPTGQEVVVYAQRFLGTPYVWGGESPTGFDCSGLVQTVYRHFGVCLPRTAAQQHAATMPVSVQTLQPGDLVFFDTTGATYSHDGIYIGHGQFLSATSSRGVRIADLHDPYYWGVRFTGATHPLHP
ncbi:C40 family peptidase [Alicyclobacillus sp. ALC3]|uniref:C40 family peptidase n=1 Tax=Alicyclobacillus sp. ALC3 TaxID=2796143 RepID=UPI002379D05B|nr:C40 family peptidase [Alicyclobacillus sp. ALC3]